MTRYFKNRILQASALAVGLGAIAGGTTLAAQVFSTDVIIQGSLCVGFDCVNGESFGFDTMRLKENNLRIHFQDTSTSASFPTRDWRIMINDTSNGGQNYFAVQDTDANTIPFRIRNDAGNHALYVDTGGEIGMGTATPVVELHIADGDSPAVRLEQNGSSGFTPQTWDIAGNETNFFVRDVTNGSQLPFKIRPGADNNSLVIDTDNEVGVGILTPSSDLHVYRNSGDATLTVQNAGSSGANATMTVTTAGAASVPSVQVTYTGSDVSGRDMLLLDNNGAPQMIFNNQATSDRWEVGAGNSFFIDHDTSSLRVFRVDEFGNVTIPGSITTGGATCGGGCDAVFTDAYDMPSIVEHAEQMWSLGYLPNVGPTIENQPINLSDKVGRMLNELETAHIYIAELNERLMESDARYDALAARLEAIESEQP